jgi:D-alanyl-D-alanine carboxypeptidase/D-alanyl-D-alanine-endopeptidase (penicillin-binding protein 4)
MKKIIVLTLFFLSAALCFAGGNEKLDKKIDSLKLSSGMTSGQWSLYAEYSDNGEPVITYNSSMSLAPASGLKVFTTSAALYYLGEDYKYETILYASGKIDKKGVLKGDLIICGSGDPTLGSSAVKGSMQLPSVLNELTDAIRNAGIVKISGDIIADESLFKGLPLSGAWNWEDMGNYYGAPVSALCINENMYKLFFRPGKETGLPASIIRSEPEIPGLRFRNYMLTGPEGSGDNGIIYSAPGSDLAEARGTVPAGAEEFSIKGAMPDPALLASGMLRESLISNGITVKGNAVRYGNEAAQFYIKGNKNPGGKEIVGNQSLPYLRLQDQDSVKIVSLFSPELKDIIYMTNKRSNNLYTEQLLRTIAAKVKGEGSEEKGIEALYSFLDKAGVPRTGVELRDGCGLSRSDMITAKAMAKLLTFNSKQKYFQSFYNSLEVAGDPDDIGYHQKFGAGTVIAKNVRLKSGLINKVRSHSGYLKTRSGRMISFSFIANNFSGSYEKIDELHKIILIVLAEQD